MKYYWDNKRVRKLTYKRKISRLRYIFKNLLSERYHMVDYSRVPSPELLSEDEIRRIHGL